LNIKAVVYSRFGDASVLSVRDIAIPVPAQGEVQVRVHMASLNPIDFKLRNGIMRLLGLPKRPAITGKDFAGVVTALGAGVTAYAIGQRVFGSVDPMKGQGSCAEFVAIDIDLIALTPDNISDAVAASLPVASGTALQALCDIAKLQAGQSVLITGASGAVGASAVQIARTVGAKITGVCSAAHGDYVKTLGVHRVIDYKTQNWLDSNDTYDVILDAAAVSTFAAAKLRLSKQGVYINTMPRPALVASALWAKLSSGQRCVPFMLKTKAPLLLRLAEMAADGTITPHIHETVTLEGVAAAQRRMQDGKIHGKVCVQML
jgi:NADPH:quinone reductase-like Zn-dependent oxidoreductase